MSAKWRSKRLTETNLPFVSFIGQFGETCQFFIVVVEQITKYKLLKLFMSYAGYTATFFWKGDSTKKIVIG